MVSSLREILFGELSERRLDSNATWKIFFPIWIGYFFREYIESGQLIKNKEMERVFGWFSERDVVLVHFEREGLVLI